MEQTMTRPWHKRLLIRTLAALFTCGLITWLEAPSARASEVGQSRKFGLGGMIGQPTGFTIKYFFKPQHAIQAALGVGWWGGHNLHIHADYAYHWYPTRQPGFDLGVYLGGGLKFFVFYYHYNPYWDDDRWSIDSRAGLGLRIPVGVSFHVNKVPLDVFLEIVPGMIFLPWLDVLVDGGVGVRYYF